MGLPLSKPEASLSSGPSLNRELARALALEAGFTEAGVVALPHVNQERDATRFEEWVRAGRAATMDYLKRIGQDRRLLRSRVEIPFPWARSAVVCWANYNSPQPRFQRLQPFEQHLVIVARPPRAACVHFA